MQATTSAAPPRQPPVNTGRSAAPGLTLFAAALLVRLLYVPLVVNVPFNDMGTFWNDGLAIAAGAGLGESLNYPLYGYFLGGLIRLYGPSLYALRAVQALLGAGIPLLVYCLAVRLNGVRAGWLAGGLAVFFPDLVFYCAVELPETIYLLLLLLALLLTARVLDGGAACWPAAALGLVLGLAQLARPFGLQLLAVLALIFIARRRLIPRVWLKVALALGLALLVALPWTLRQYQRYGIFTFSSTKTGYFLYGATMPESGYEGLLASIPDELRDDPEIAGLLARVAPLSPPGIHYLSHPLLNDALTRRAWSRIVANPYGYARGWVSKLRYFFFRNADWFLELYPTFGLARGWWYDGFVYGLLFLGGVGMWRLRGRPLTLPLVASIALAALTTAATVYVTRYRLPVLPVFMIFAGAQLAEMRLLARWSVIACGLLLALRLLAYPGLDAERLASASYFLLFGDRINAARNLDAMTTTEYRELGRGLLQRYDAFVAGPPTPH